MFSVRVFSVEFSNRLDSPAMNFAKNMAIVTELIYIAAG